MELLNDLPVLSFPAAEGWRQWLDAHFQQTSGIWLKFAKKASGIRSIHYEEALDLALCYGWIDGQAKPYNETFYLQKFTPRRSKSMWSKRNIVKAEALIASGAMQASGLVQIEAAQHDGRWEQAYDSPRTIT